MGSGKVSARQRKGQRKAVGACRREGSKKARRTRARATASVGELAGGAVVRREPSPDAVRRLQSSASQPCVHWPQQSEGRPITGQRLKTTHHLNTPHFNPP